MFNRYFARKQKKFYLNYLREYNVISYISLIKKHSILKYDFLCVVLNIYIVILIILIFGYDTFLFFRFMI